ncbi:MAG TPA: hypothetical protein VHC90_05595 [Bryobacteraceae bacterium]|nr:hypothetical protein [Bryobacteraceae bacterium]
MRQATKNLRQLQSPNSKVVILDPDIHALFPNAQAVNDALRLVIKLCKITERSRASRKHNPRTGN